MVANIDAVTPPPPAPPPLATFLFDLDGTLIDSIELILSAFRHTMKIHRGTVPPDREWLAGVGTPLRAQIRAFAQDPADVEAMIETYRAFQLEHHDRLVREYPGTFEAIRELRDRGDRLGIVTSKMRAQSLLGLRRCRLDGLIETMVCADDIDRHKPDPAPIRRALELLESDASSAVYVGDSPHDMAAGRAAGVRIAAALWGPFERSDLSVYDPDYWLTAPSDITDVC